MRTLGVVAIVFLGLFCILNSLAILLGSYQVIFDSIALLLYPAGMLVLGALLIAGRNRLAEKWFQDSTLVSSIDRFSLLRIVLIFFGVLMILLAIPEILSEIFGKYAFINMMNTDLHVGEKAVEYDFWGVTLPQLIAPIARFGLGLLLIMRSASISERLWIGEDIKESVSLKSPTCPFCGTPFDPADYRVDADQPLCFTCRRPISLGADSWNERGMSLDEEGKYDEAIKYYDRALELSPADGDIWNNRGMSLESLGRYREALESYEKALQFNPDDAEVQSNKAITEVKLKKEEAGPQ